MKIISWNVNGIRAVERKGELLHILEKQDPDILLLQEIKGKANQFSSFLIDNENYFQHYHSAEKPGYSGTGIWIKKHILVENFTIGMLPHHNNDTEGRVARVDIRHEDKQVSILSVYFPNGGKSEQAFQDKLVFYEQFLEYVNHIRERNECIWAGDVNCAHNEIDLARPKENRNSIGFLPVERMWIDKVIANDWIDVFRSHYPEEVCYSWWDQKSRARERNVGWRIDYFFVNQQFYSQKSIKIKYLNEQLGSDHCPVVFNFV